jgi:hypothetical protein
MNSRRRSTTRTRERKERNNLAELRKTHGLDDAPALTVGREDVELIIAKWAQYPYTA